MYFNACCIAQRLQIGIKTEFMETGHKVDGGQCVKSHKIGGSIIFSGRISLYEFKGHMINIIKHSCSCIIEFVKRVAKKR